MPFSRFVGAGSRALVFVGVLAAGPVFALPVTVTVTLDVAFSDRYDYASRSYQPFTGSGQVELRFENTPTAIYDYGTTTISDYMGGTRFTSPFTAQLASDPYGGGPAAAFQYTFPNVSDYRSDFIEQFAAQGNTYSWSTLEHAVYSYHIELRISRRSPSKGGVGTEDYAFTPEDNLAFLTDATLNPNQYSVYFSETAYIYDADTYVSRYGSGLFDFHARVVSLNAGAAAVPEPATTLMLGAGLVLLGCARRGRESAVAVS